MYVLFACFIYTDVIDLLRKAKKNKKKKKKRGQKRIEPYIDLFKVDLCYFTLEMKNVTQQRIRSLLAIISLTLFSIHY